MKKREYPYYKDFLKKISDVKKFFDISYFPVKREKFSLLKFEFLKYKTRPLLVLMAGCHGEEPAPVLALFKKYRLFRKEVDALKVNLIIYPLVNPRGFDRNKRLNRKGLNCNNNWIHKEKIIVASEVRVIAKDMKNYTPLIFASIHEDDETKKEFYIFSFGDRKYENPLIKVGGKYFPILKDGKYSDIEVRGGVVYNHHDGSAEDFMFHRGCKFSCCTETPSHQPLGRRIRCNVDLVLKLIELTAS